MKITTTPTHEEIARQARQLWQERGRPDGHNEEIWLEAEDQLTSHPFEEESSSAPVSPERIKAQTAAASVVEFQITPAVPQQEAIQAALQRKDARAAKTSQPVTPTPEPDQPTKST